MKKKQEPSKYSTPVQPGTGFFSTFVKPAIIFLVVTAIIGGRIPETLAESTGENVNLLIAAIYGIVGVMLSFTRLHFIATSFLLFLVVGFNLPGGVLHVVNSLEGLLLFPLMLVSQWMAAHISRIFAFLALLVGLGLLLPSELPPPMDLEPGYLLASLVALLVTPILHILTTKRDRGIE